MNKFLTSIQAFLGLTKYEESSSKQIDSDGTIRWYKNGVLHRENDLPAVIYKNNTKEYWINGEVHRDNGPAVTTPSGTKLWFQHDLLHREDGAAVVYSQRRKEWYLNGIQYSKEEFDSCLIKQELNKTLSSTLNNKSHKQRSKV